MALKQYARGLWASFISMADAFKSPNGMEENLRLIDDHLGLYTLQPPIAPGSALPVSPADGDGQIYNDGSYATFNGGTWRTYSPRRGVRAVLVAGTESWLNIGTAWAQFSVLDSSAAIAAATAAGAAQVQLATEKAALTAADRLATAADRDQAALFAQASQSAALIYDSVSIGRAVNASTSGPASFFQVKKGGLDADGSSTLSRQSMYQRTSSTTQTFLYAILTAGEFDALFAMLAPLGYVFSFVDPTGRASFAITQSGLVKMAQAEIGALTVVSISAAEEMKIASNSLIGRVPPGFCLTVMDPQGRSAAAIRTDADNTFVTRALESSKLNGFPISLLIAATRRSAYLQGEVTHLLAYGQSNSIGKEALDAISLTQRFDSVMPSGGVRTNVNETSSALPLFASLVPLVEKSEYAGYYNGETLISGACDTVKTMALNENGIAVGSVAWQLLGTSAGRNGAVISSLSKGDGSGIYASMISSIASCFALAQAMNKSYVVGACLWVQGESDQAGPTPSAAYKAAVLQLKSDLNADAKAITGQTDDIPMIASQIAIHKIYSPYYPSIALAQLDLHKQKVGFNLACPMYLFNFNPSNNIHLDPRSQKWMGEFHGLAYKRIMVDRRAWDIVRPLSVIRQGKVILVKFHVPVAPLVYDTNLVALNTNHGFDLVDSTGAAVGITSDAIVAPDTVKIVASTASLLAGGKLRYAFSGTGISGSVNGPRGNLRDSQGDQLILDPLGSGKRLDNWCPIFEETL